MLLASGLGRGTAFARDFRGDRRLGEGVEGSDGCDIVVGIKGGEEEN